MLTHQSQHSFVLIGMFAREVNFSFFFKKELAAKSFSSPCVLSKHILVLLEKEEKNCNGVGKSFKLPPDLCQSARGLIQTIFTLNNWSIY